ncbi:hypothetical protein GCM10008018_36610 [Paenibacillus marchantiophytorum]|uniref:Uncharacterized protein n=1 Tax=Paenibacillus marchantiophytorum TaxID=1619310 RepID=A0ABQ1ETX4_9BACL|nr:hypothetical protein [Paenibacillus marchantiophytorum]GFZ87136.1 hypothetical protein GCM10008018_36610 [Paenibacillus marchantiophytorum]
MEEAASPNWVIYSERALDTLCLSGLRGRLSRGVLEPVRTYYALNGSNVTMYRPVLDNKVEDITQADLDVLRAVVTHYVFEHGYDSRNSNAPMPEDDDLWAVIKPERIRSLLQVSRHDLPTEQISRSLKKLQSLRIEAGYHVRSGGGAEKRPITGNLFKFGTSYSASGKRVNDYVLYFDTEWGRAFLHNVCCGNFVVVRDIPYRELDNGAKSLFYMVMAMQNAYFYRKQDKLLQLMNSKDGQNRPRAIQRLEGYLNQLSDLKLVTWWLNGNVYHVNRLYDPIKGAMPELELGTGNTTIQIESESHETDENARQMVNQVTVEPQADHDTWQQHFERVLNKLLSKEQRSELEEIQFRIVQAVDTMQERTERMSEENKQGYKQTILRKDWDSFTPYYVWTQTDFRLWFEANQAQEKWNDEYVRFQEVFKKIEADPKLQDDLMKWTDALEQFYEFRLTCSL